MSKGFESKSRTDIVEDMKSRARNLFGQNVNLAENSPLGILIQLFSWPSYLLWEALKKVYNAGYINTATGQDLDNLAKNIGISRFASQKAVGEITFEGNNGTQIEEGFLIEADENEPKQFETTEEVAIEDGEATAEIISVEGGSEYNLPANTITEIVNPISGLDSATNEDETLGGRDRESDSELRERYLESLDKTGGSTTDAIRANILQETDATDCIVLENYTESTDDNDLPPKSIEAIVYGGADEDIAEAILTSKAGGIEPNGSTEITLEDDSGNDQIIRFERATQVDIYVDITLDTNSDYEGDEEVEDEIIDYIHSLQINEDVIYQKFVDVVFNVDGVVDVTGLAIGTSSDPTGTSNIEIGFREVAEISADEIVIDYA